MYLFLPLLSSVRGLLAKKWKQQKTNWSQIHPGVVVVKPCFYDVVAEFNQVNDPAVSVAQKQCFPAAGVVLTPG